MDPLTLHDKHAELNGSILSLKLLSCSIAVMPYTCMDPMWIDWDTSMFVYFDNFIGFLISCSMRVTEGGGCV